MPAVKPGSLILVTGASGYLAAHTVEAFLDNGFNVRGTVRSKSKGDYLASLFKNKKSKFEYVIVEDIGKEGAFDEAVKGVEGVAHTASPFHFDAVEPEELFVPAKQGTLGVLKSLQKANPEVKRVVVTSSVAAVVNSEIKAPHTFTEKDWNPISLKVVEEKGRDADGMNKYRASKTLAEQTFWKFFEEEKPGFDGVAINPPLILGPIIHQVDSPDSLNTSVAAFYTWLDGKHKQDELPTPAGNYVDVREAALAHVRALTVPEAGGERFITSNGQISGNDYVLGIRKAFPDIKNVPTGNSDPEYIKKTNHNITFHDGSKAERVLGIKYRPIDDTLVDMAKSLKERFGA